MGVPNIMGFPMYIGDKVGVSLPIFWWAIPPAAGGPENLSCDVPQAHFGGRTPDTCLGEKRVFGSNSASFCTFVGDLYRA